MDCDEYQISDQPKKKVKLHDVIDENKRQQTISATMTASQEHDVTTPITSVVTSMSSMGAATSTATQGLDGNKTEIKQEIKAENVDFDNCYHKDGHNNRMDRTEAASDDGLSSKDKQDLQEKRQSVQQCIQLLMHAHQCRDTNCCRQGCKKMKAVITHTKSCRYKPNTSCHICKQLILLCCYHSNHCTEGKCSIIFCHHIKQRRRQQQREHRLQQAQLMRRRMASMQRTAPNQQQQ